jgi:protein transport protein SEC24
LRSIGGRILVFSSSINSIGWGGLLPRDDPKLYNTDKEKNILTAAVDHYMKLATDCVQ